MKNLKEKIFLKVYNWIDSFFNSFQKRRRNLIILVSLFWIWQYLWQILFFLELFQVKSYDSLFSFMNIMSGYTSSYLIQFSYEMISKGTISFINIGESFVDLISLSFLLCMILTILFCLQANKRKVILFTFFNFMWIFGLVIFLGAGFHSASINELVTILHDLSITGLLGSAISLGYLLFKFVQFCCRCRKTR